MCFSDAGAAENISMTLTELSVFIKKQEMELQLKPEKEKEEGDLIFYFCGRGAWRIHTWYFHLSSGVKFKISTSCEQLELDWLRV